MRSFVILIGVFKTGGMGGHLLPSVPNALLRSITDVDKAVLLNLLEHKHSVLCFKSISANPGKLTILGFPWARSRV
ncbi:hypothetical protein CEXT_418251 [Caerostris extrusa]|uniref:Uncharacterized protein n=1 Tax=Caerostris extrusa TaxID=172846 RepID=A0AAV4WXJ2_CAEEX|nr:hypothetical protein CEXT_418251 [Caerostris extrusa]